MKMRMMKKHGKYSSLHNGLQVNLDVVVLCDR